MQRRLEPIQAELAQLQEERPETTEPTKAIEQLLEKGIVPAEVWMAMNESEQRSLAPRRISWAMPLKLRVHLEGWPPASPFSVWPADYCWRRFRASSGKTEEDLPESQEARLPPLSPQAPLPPAPKELHLSPSPGGLS